MQLNSNPITNFHQAPKITGKISLELNSAQQFLINLQNNPVNQPILNQFHPKHRRNPELHPKIHHQPLH